MEKAVSYDEFNRVVSQVKPGPVAGSNVEFNIYDLENFVGPNARPIPFKKAKGVKCIGCIGCVVMMRR